MVNKAESQRPVVGLAPLGLRQPRPRRRVVDLPLALFQRGLAGQGGVAEEFVFGLFLGLAIGPVAVAFVEIPFPSGPCGSAERVQALLDILGCLDDGREGSGDEQQGDGCLDYWVEGVQPCSGFGEGGRYRVWHKHSEINGVENAHSRKSVNKNLHLTVNPNRGGFRRFSRMGWHDS